MIKFLSVGWIDQNRMSRKTPLAADGFLRETDGISVVALGSLDWFAWLQDERHHTFHFAHPTGGFTARREHKQRGHGYWVAYRQFHNKLYKSYLGKTEALTETHLCDVSKALAAQIASTE